MFHIYYTLYIYKSIAMIKLLKLLTRLQFGADVGGRPPH